MVPIPKGLRLDLSTKYTIPYTLSLKSSKKISSEFHVIGSACVKNPCIFPRTICIVKPMVCYSYIVVSNNVMGRFKWITFCWF
jgi:hypothetical protein